MKQYKYTFELNGRKNEVIINAYCEASADQIFDESYMYDDVLDVEILNED